MKIPTDQPMMPQRMAGNASNPKSRAALNAAPAMANTLGDHTAILSVGGRGGFSFLGFGGMETFTGFGAGAGVGGLIGSAGFGEATTGVIVFGFGLQAALNFAKNPGPFTLGR